MVKLDRYIGTSVFFSILAVLGPGVEKLVIVLGISQWMQYGRLARAHAATAGSK